MTSIPALFHLSPAGWVAILFCGMLVGISKTGLSGASILVVSLIAGLFGGKSSAGLVLPMLLAEDMFGVWYFHRHADWGHVVRLLPWTVCGIVASVVYGWFVSNQQFTTMIGAVTLASVIVLFWRELQGNETFTAPQGWWFSAVIGMVSGFSTMIGNASGPVMAVYLLSMRLPKNVYIGTGAWFFFIVNLIKVPFHLFYWGAITIESRTLDLLTVPAIAAGAVFGFQTVKLIPERPYRIVIMAMTAIASVKLFW